MNPSSDSGDRSAHRELFAIDLRSLALFRIGLAVLIVCDLANRARFLVEHYTDQGLVPRWIVDEARSEAPLALHFLNGSTAWEGFLFALSGALAVMLLLGARTRIAIAGLWVLMLSLFQRNLLILNAGDGLVALLLFWSMFLPLGARWSIDAGRGRDARVLTPASAALLLQLALLYFFAGLVKNTPTWWNGTALNLALGQGLWVWPAGEWLREQEVISRLLTYATPVFEVLVPLLLFSPVATRAVRYAAIPALLSFQLGLGLCLDLGLFPFYASLGLAAFLPSSFWERLARAGRRAPPPHEAASEPPLLARGQYARLADVAVVAALALGTAAGVAAQLDRKLPPPLAQLARVPALEQRWVMYGVVPDLDLRVRTRGLLEDGSQFDFATDRDGAPFAPLREMLAHYRGKTYFGRFHGLETPHHASLARWLCDRWSREQPSRPRLMRLQLDLSLTRLLPRGRRAPPVYQPFYRHDCARRRD